MRSFLEEDLINSINYARNVHKLPQQPQRPVGFIRTKLQNRAVLLNTLVDSGNLFGDLISEELQKRLKLPIMGRVRTVGTAHASGKVTILGKTRPLSLYMEGLKRAVTIAPYVVRELAHPLNLGQAFLRRNQADMNFRENGIQLKIADSTCLLSSSDAPLDRPSIDTRIRTVLELLKSQGGNPLLSEKNDVLDLRVNEVHEDEAQVPGVLYDTRKKPLQWGTTKVRLHNAKTTLLPPQSTMVVMAKRGKPGAIPQKSLPEGEYPTMFFPTMTSKFLNRNQLFAHPGAYIGEGDTVKILITNLGYEEKTIPGDCHLGHVTLAEAVSSASVNVLDHRPQASLSKEELKERREFLQEQLKLDENPNLKDRPDIKESVMQLFLNNWAAVSVNEHDYGETDLAQFRIEIPKGTPPVRARVRPLNPLQESDLRKQLDDWISSQIIEPSVSPWASALVPCKKKGSERLRWAIDYRAVNKLTVKDAYPLPSIENNLHKLAGSGYFSTLDSAGAFHSMKIPQEDRDYTSFVSPFGSFRFTRLPFGLANAPSAYSRLVQMALDKLPPGFAIAYIDDVLVHSKTLDDHLQHLTQVVELHVECGMKLNLKKCHLFATQVEYLGHVVTPKNIEMCPSFVERILDWPVPRNGKELRSFLGFAGYYRSFIREYGPLTNEMNAIKMKETIVWNEELDKKFNTLKQMFKDSPVRGYPRYDLPEPFILDSDFSATNLAAVLSQVQDGKERFLGCIAKKCNRAERNYPSHKGEAASLILGLKRFEHILRARPFIVRTDSKCVEFINSMKEVRGIWARWQCFLSSFVFKVVHRPGKKQINADCLSRRPGVPEGEDPLKDEPFADVEDIYAVGQPVQEVSQTELTDKVSQDPILKHVFRYVQQGIKPDKEIRKQLSARGMAYVNIFECLLIRKGVLYYQPPTVNGITPPKRVCLPMALYDKAFMMCHADPSAISGHYGTNKTYLAMKERFYFPTMYPYIMGRIANCVTCATKGRKLPKSTHRMHREQLSYFNQKIYTDLVGPLPVARYQGRSYRYILTIQDGFTRHLVAVAVPDQTTKTVVEALISRFICVYGCPENIHSDNGSSYSSHLFRETMRALGIFQTFTPVYTPQSDRVERAHSLLGKLLRSDTRFGVNQWPEKLPAAVLAYNVTTNRITGVSPFEALYGHAPNLPVDMIFPFNRQEGQTWSAYVADLQHKFARISARMMQTQGANIRRENAKFQAKGKPVFQVGDCVYYFLSRIKKGMTSKLDCRWAGPFEIRKVVSESLVIIYPKGDWAQNPKEIATVVNRLKKIVPQEGAIHTTPPHVIDMNAFDDEIDEEAVVLQHDPRLDGEEVEEGDPLPMRLPRLGPLDEDQGLRGDVVDPGAGGSDVAQSPLVPLPDEELNVRQRLQLDRQIREEQAEMQDSNQREFDSSLVAQGPTEYEGTAKELRGEEGNRPDFFDPDWSLIVREADKVADTNRKAAKEAMPDPTREGAYGGARPKGPVEKLKKGAYHPEMSPVRGDKEKKSEQIEAKKPMTRQRDKDLRERVELPPEKAEGRSELQKKPLVKRRNRSLGERAKPPPEGEEDEPISQKISRGAAETTKLLLKEYYTSNSRKKKPKE